MDIPLPMKTRFKLNKNETREGSFRPAIVYSMDLPSAKIKRTNNKTVHIADRTKVIIVLNNKDVLLFRLITCGFVFAFSIVFKGI
jgi:hypothetical protein